MWADFEERVIDLNSSRETEAVRRFLSRFDLTFEAVDLDYTVAFYREDEIIATGSIAGEVFRNIAVAAHLQGEGLTAAVISHLMREAAGKGVYHYFVYTKPDTAVLFGSLGFNEIARVEPHVVLLEAGLGSIRDYCAELSTQAENLPAGPRAALVVNCNPFTLGHKAVIAKAAQENAAAIVMVVSTERSIFPFATRLRLVREGLAEYDNILLLPGGKYVISAATFPGYFTKGTATIDAQTRLDATVFARHIAPALKVTKRYVGEEPYCPVTRAYNQALNDILPQYGIAVKVMPRITFNGEAISASQVRELIRSEDWDRIKHLVPDTTYRYLVSEEAKPVIDKIKGSNARH